MGKFITFEGGEGSGKTTHIESMAKALRADGYSVRTTHDPGGAEISIGIRPFLLDKKFQVCREAEFLLYLAARAELVDKVIMPELERVDFVLCDRFHDSTAVYQGVIRGWNKNRVYNAPAITENILDYAHRKFSRGLVPEKTFLFDVNPVLGLNRSKGIEIDEGRWEEMGVEIHAKINDAFLERAGLYSDRFVIIDANMEIETVETEMLRKFYEEVVNNE